MTDATAANSGAVRFFTSTSSSQPAIGVQIPFPHGAKWLADVQRRLSGSVGTRESAANGQWLSREVATAAKSFFEATSDILPSEPYIYSSRAGDLVAEFRTSDGQLTMVVSNRSALAFAVVNGDAFHLEVSLDPPRPVELRKELASVMDRLRVGKHGPVADNR